MKKTIEDILTDFYIDRGFIKKKHKEGFTLVKSNKVGYFRLNVIIEKKNNRNFYTPSFGVRHNEIEVAIDQFFLNTDNNSIKKTSSKRTTINAGHGFVVGISKHNADSYGYEEVDELVKLFENNYVDLYSEAVFPFFKKYTEIENLKEFYVEEKGLVPTFNPLLKYLYKIVILKILRENTDEVTLNTIEILKKSYKKYYPDQFKNFIDYLDGKYSC